MKSTQVNEKGTNSALAYCFDRLEQSIKKTNNKYDLDYYLYHKNRYGYIMTRIIMLVSDNKATILDVGSHYLHLSSMISCLGYKVTGIDVPAFSELSIIKERSAEYDIRNISYANIENGLFLTGMEDHFDCILMNEVIEHLAFNPILFWRRIYELLKIGGLVYITTPNAYRLLNVMKAVFKLISMSGMGLGINSIFSEVTYGHHWKEYSAKELSRYFRCLSPDFLVTINHYSYNKQYVHPFERRHEQIKDSIRKLATMLGDKTRFFSDDLEVAVRLRARTKWNLVPPCFA